MCIAKFYRTDIECKQLTSCEISPCNHNHSVFASTTLANMITATPSVNSGNSFVFILMNHVLIEIWKYILNNQLAVYLYRLLLRFIESQRSRAIMTQYVLSTHIYDMKEHCFVITSNAKTFPFLPWYRDPTMCLTHRRIFTSRTRHTLPLNVYHSVWVMYLWSLKRCAKTNKQQISM